MMSSPPFAYSLDAVFQYATYAPTRCSSVRAPSQVSTPRATAPTKTSPNSTLRRNLDCRPTFVAAVTRPFSGKTFFRKRSVRK